MDGMIRYTDQHGGGTFDSRTLAPVELPDGYAVALGPGTAAVLNGSRRALRLAVEGVRRAYPDAPYIGTWRDAEGVIHLDPVVVLPDRASALALGRALGQLAVWSFADESELPCAA